MIDYEDTNDRTEVVSLFDSYGCMVHFLSRPKNQDTKAKWTEHLSKAKEKE
jgi:hypothetical protein